MIENEFHIIKYRSRKSLIIRCLKLDRFLVANANTE